MIRQLLLLALFLTIFTTYGQVWYEVPSGTNVKLNAVSFGSELVGFIGGNDSTLLKTTDGGQSWTAHSTQGLIFPTHQKDIIDVDFIDALEGYAMVGNEYGGVQYKTEDGGDTWFAAPVSNMCFPLANYSFNSSTGYVIGADCFRGKMISKFVNDSLISVTQLSWGNEYIRTIKFYNNQFGVAAGDDGEVHRTFDGGLTWDTIATVTPKTIWDIEFINDSTIYAATDTVFNTLVISTDSGATWVEHTPSLSFFYPTWYALTQLQNQTLVAVGSAYNDQGAILWGADFDGFWYTEPAPHVLYDAAAISDTLGIAVGDSGLIMINAQNITSVKEPTKKVTVDLYPNPASNTITIDVSQGDMESVVIYDMTGRKVFQKSGATNRINVASFPSGMYHVSVTTTNGREVISVIIQ